MMHACHLRLSQVFSRSSKGDRHVMFLINRVPLSRTLAGMAAHHLIHTNEIDQYLLSTKVSMPFFNSTCQAFKPMMMLHLFYLQCLMNSSLYVFTGCCQPPSQSWRAGAHFPTSGQRDGLGAGECPPALLQVSSVVRG